uniref:Uncharacterized protein n=1 Tax=Anguilla anguilla TaxID=7936 RepID=A0A0E9SF52_ANGAN
MTRQQLVHLRPAPGDARVHYLLRSSYSLKFLNAPLLKIAFFLCLAPYKLHARPQVYAVFKKKRKK